MRVDELKPPGGATRPARRVGRGIGGHGGKTAGRGTKGQRARNTVRPGFEGGQMPIKQRVPKLKGFNNPFRVEYQAINLDVLETAAADHDLDAIDPTALQEHGLVGKGAFVKVLARGQLTRALRVTAHRFSKAAEAAIIAAGGTVDVLPLPFRSGRPPVRGNQFTNR
jgi:large subunit ribosomal protein L15